MRYRLCWIAFPFSASENVIPAFIAWPHLIGFLIYMPQICIYIHYIAVSSIGCSILFVCWCTNQNMAFDVTGSWVFSLSLHIIQYVSHIELCLIPYWFTHPFMDGRRSLSAPLIDLKWKWFHIFITNPQDCRTRFLFKISTWFKWIFAEDFCYLKITSPLLGV